MRQSSLEVLNVGCQLAVECHGKLGAIVIESDVSADELIRLASLCHYIILVQDRINPFEEDLYIRDLVSVCRQYKPNVFLLSATLFGKSIAPAIAVQLQVGLTADCTELRMDSSALIQIRPALGGELLAEIKTLNNHIQMATVASGGVQAAPPQAFLHTGTQLFKVDTAISRIELTDWRKAELSATPEHSEIVVGVGRGIKYENEFLAIRKFAQDIGASIGFTRAVIDESWADERNLIGQTGKSIKPRIYFAFGISGAIHHITGIRGAQYIIAVNTDREAPIFKYAHYGIVAEPLQFITDISKHLAAQREPSPAADG
ncbi:electron transfer flavoprotein subunit alpha/FixB family protein [Paenibacillus sophorae]|nr:electron transfer flavoprotein subunit alpha/FixB family protein [Paenibacillus sophorae]